MDNRPTPAWLGYGRVSTVLQDTVGQREELFGGGCWHVVTEEISSGKKHRQGLKDVIAMCRPGDTLVVTAIDRVARSMIETLTLVEDLEERGIGFKSLSQPFDTTTPEGRMMLGVLASFAQYERDLIRRRTSAGLAAARAKGHAGGRRRSLTGARLEKANALLMEGKLTQAEVAAALGVCRSTIQRYCVNGGKPATAKAREEFLSRVPDPVTWLAETDDPLRGTNPNKRRAS